MPLWPAIPFLVAAWVAAASPARAELLPLECDDGASVSLTYLDSSPEFEQRDELDECNEAPVGDWNRLGLVEQTDAASVDALGFVRSEDGLVLEVSSQLALEVEDDELASIVALVEGEARFRAPEADEDVAAEVIVEISRSGELEEAELSLAVVGPGVDLFEDLDDEQGELRFPVELEPDEDYRAVLVAGGALTDTGSGSHSLRFRVDVLAPEPAAPLLLGAGALVLGVAGFRARPARDS